MGDANNLLALSKVIFRKNQTLHVVFYLGNERVDIFYWVANPSIWMYYLPDPSTNRVLFVYM